MSPVNTVSINGVPIQHVESLKQGDGSWQVRVTHSQGIVTTVEFPHNSYSAGLAEHFAEHLKSHLNGEPTQAEKAAKIMASKLAEAAKAPAKPTLVASPVPVHTPPPFAPEPSQAAVQAKQETKEAAASTSEPLPPLQGNKEPQTVVAPPSTPKAAKVTSKVETKPVEATKSESVQEQKPATE